MSLNDLCEEYPKNSAQADGSFHESSIVLLVQILVLLTFEEIIFNLMGFYLNTLKNFYLKTLMRIQYYFKRFTMEKKAFLFQLQ